MPKLERLEWITPLSAGRGVTLSDDETADHFLAEHPFALLLGVLYDSQLATRRAFAAPLALSHRLGHLDPARIAVMEEEELAGVFSQKPALHRFPRKFAGLTRQLAGVVIEEYGGDTTRLWLEAGDVMELGRRLLALPAFGVDKTNWTVGMLGLLGVLPFGGWEEYRVPARGRG